MSQSIKKRVVFALLGGAFIPVSYLLLIQILEDISPGILRWLGDWFTIPVIWPAYLYEYLVPPPKDLDLMFGGLPDSGVWFFLLAGNFILYSLLVYLGLWWKQRMPRLR
jgi:hypothetical protein